MNNTLFLVMVATMFFVAKVKGQEPEIFDPVPGSFAEGYQTFTFSHFGDDFKALLHKYQYQVLIGEDGPGSSDLSINTDCQLRGVSCMIPTDGRTLYVRFRYRERGKSWSHKDYTYRTRKTKGKSSIIFPKSGTELTGSEVTFTIKRNKRYPLYSKQHTMAVGTTRKGSTEIYSAPFDYFKGETITIKNLPTNGETVYVRFYEDFWKGGSFTDYKFIAYADKAVMQTPVRGTVLNATKTTFTWDKRSGQEFDITVGSSGSGSDDITQRGTSTTGNTITVDLSNAGTDKIYVRLWSKMSSGNWVYNDYGYNIGTPTEVNIKTEAYLSDGGTVSGNGKYNFGETVNLEATSATGYDFMSWTEYQNRTYKIVSTDAKYSFTADKDRKLVANFALPIPDFTIAISASPANGGIFAGEGTYRQGETVRLEAVPSTGYDFVNWTVNGKEVSTDALYNFTADSDRTLVANFAVQGSDLSIVTSSSPANSGTVSGEGTYSKGQTVKLEATPSTGYDFVNWTENGKEVSTNSTLTIVVNENRELTANFSMQTGISKSHYNNDVKVYPNPTTGYINIELNELMNANDTEFFLINNSGKITSLKAVTIKSNMLQVNIENHPAGVYYLHIVNKEFSKTEKIILKE